MRYLSKGADYLIHCINPDHDDAHPSMRVDKVSGVYHCFGCGHKGNLLTEYGYSPSVIDTKSLRIKQKISKILAGELKIPVGAVPFKHEHRGISVDTYNHFGAFIHENYEGRIVFPIKNAANHTVAFLGRYIHSEASPKYKVYPEHTPLPLFPPKPEIYNGSIILVEGLFDMLNLYEHGLRNIVSTFGTSTVFKKVKEALDPYLLQGVNKVYIMFDGDEAGRVATKKLMSIIPEKYNPEEIELPDGIDPGDLSREDVDKLKHMLYGGGK